MTPNEEQDGTMQNLGEFRREAMRLRPIELVASGALERSGHAFEFQLSGRKQR